MSLMLTTGDINYIENSARDIIDQWHTTITIMQPLPLENQPNYDKLLREFTGEMLYEKILIQAERKDIVNNYTNDLLPNNEEYGEKDDGHILYAIPNIIPIYDANGIQTGVKQFKPHPESVIAIDDTSDRYHIISMRDRIDETLIMIERYTGQVPDCAELTIISKVITANGIYNACDDGVNGYGNITVNVPTYEEENGELIDQINSLNTQIGELQDEISNKQNEINGLQAEIETLQSNADIYLGQINDLRTEVNNLQVEINNKQDEINRLQAEVNRLNSDLNYANSKAHDIIGLQHSYIGADMGTGDNVYPVDINLEIIERNISEVYKAGKKSQYDEFWDFYQQNGLKPDYNSAFRGWKDELYNPKYPIVCRESANWSVSEYMFYQSTVTDTKVDITLPKNQTFKQGFFGCFWLVTIRKLIVDASTKFSNSFAYCQSLVNLTIEGVIGQSYFDLSYSKFLSKESIISVINALSTETSGLTVTLSQTAIMNAGYFATPEDWKEWESLIATKPNWTIALIDKE